MMRLGIVGLPNAGKSSLFNLLTHARAKVDLYPFTTIDQNVGIVGVPDDRLQTLGEILKPPKLTPATIEIIDIAGLVDGASKGEGLGNQFLGHIREVDMIIHLLRGFTASSVPHIYDSVNPERDREIVEAELALADLAVITNRLQKIIKGPRTEEVELLTTIKTVLEQGQPLRCLNARELETVKPLNLFCCKPLLYALNLDPNEGNTFSINREKIFTFSAQLEEEIADFAEPEKRELRHSTGLNEAGPLGIIETSFTQLGLIRFYTVKGDETRAWSVPHGTKMADAAGKIHSDLKEGFIKSEVASFPDLVAAGGFHEAKNTGKVRIEGREYIVQDGDVILVKFKA